MSTQIRRAVAAAALLVPAIVALALFASFSSGNGQTGADLPPGVNVPADARYRSAVESLLGHPAARLASLTVSGAGGQVRVIRSRNGTGFPAQHLNPLGISVAARVLAGRFEDPVRVDKMQLARGRLTGRLRWLLLGRIAGKPWTAVVAPNGTGLRTLSGPSASPKARRSTA